MKQFVKNKPNKLGFFCESNLRLGRNIANDPVAGDNFCPHIFSVLYVFIETVSQFVGPGLVSFSATFCVKNILSSFSKNIF